MSMPKGYKKETGYGSAKSLGGKSYHEIAEIMTARDYRMKHSNARNVFISGLIKIAGSVCNVYEKHHSYEELKKIAIDPRFQEAVSEYMREIEHEKSQGINK